jgi:hypothetical protein
MDEKVDEETSGGDENWPQMSQWEMGGWEIGRTDRD